VSPSRSRPSGRAATPEANGRLLGVTHAGVVVLLVLALANGLFLYLAPARAEGEYAWSIQPPINAACIGAGYLAGCVATGLVVFATRCWRSLRILPLALAVLAVTVLAATLIHADRFRWDFPPTWLWTAVYVAVPFAVPAFWRLQERREGLPPAPDARLRPLRVGSAALGAVLAACGVALFVAPTRMAELWPWALTPLLARVIAGWYLLAASVLLSAAVSLRRWHEVPIPYATLGAWSVLLLALPAVYADDLADRPAATATWVVMHAVLLVLTASALRRSIPAMRAAGQRL